MAEFCKECYINYVIDSNDLYNYNRGKIKINISKYKDLCECCNKITNIVIDIEETNNIM